ncbi:MAG: rod shape-determining protein MreD [Vicinamibacteria bacterium]
MKALGVALALLAALLLQSVLTRVLPAHARIFDPFLLVMVYYGLSGGETQGMVIGAIGGWIQDIQFGGGILGLTGLCRVLLGFAVGMAGTRFHLTEPAPRALVLFLAGVADALVFTALAGAFDVGVTRLSPLLLLTRAAVNAAVGVVFFELIDRRLRRRRHA